MPRIDLIQIRRGTEAEWNAANPLLADGELGHVEDLHTLVVGNGVDNFSALTQIGAGGGGGGTTIIVQEADVTVSSAVDTLDFGAGFDITISPAGEANITIDTAEITASLATQAELDAVSSALNDHIVDVMDAHNATAIGYAGHGILAPGDVADALNTLADASGTASLVTVADTTDASCSVALFESPTGSLGPKTDAGLTYNAATGVLTATGFNGPLTGNVTGNVTGSSGSCTGNSATATAASGLLSATTTVSVSAAAAPTTGQVLKATSSTTATWQSESGSGSVATDAIWDVAGDTVYGTGANTASRLAIGAALSVYCVNSGATAPEWVASNGTGSIARVISPAFTTPNIGVATATSVNKVALTAPATSATLTIADGATLTVSASATVSNGTHSGTNTGDNATNSQYSGLVSNATHTGDVTGATALAIDKTAITGKTSVAADGTDELLLSDASDAGNLKRCTVSSIVSLASGSGAVSTDSIWNVAGDTVYATGNDAAVRLAIGAALSVYCANSGATAPEWVASSGTGNVARVVSPAFTTPNIGAATATSVNKVALTAPATAATLTIADGATLTVSASATVSNGTHSGTNTGDQTNISGNAATVTVADAGGDTTTWVLLGTAQTGSLAPATDAGLTYQATTNVLTAGGFAGPLTGDVTGNVSGSSGSCTGNSVTATTATNITTANEASDTTCFLVFVTAATGDLGAKTNAALTLNSSTGAFGATSIELGHAADTTLTRVSAGVIAVEGDNLQRATDVANTKIAAIGITIDGGGSAITTGIKGRIEVPFACTINRATLIADQTGSIVVDIWKDTYANYPPVAGDSITASAKPTLSSANKSQDSTLTGWTTSIAAGDVLFFNVDSATTVTQVTLVLKVTKT